MSRSGRNWAWQRISSRSWNWSVATEGKTTKAEVDKAGEQGQVEQLGLGPKPSISQKRLSNVQPQSAALGIEMKGEAQGDFPSYTLNTQDPPTRVPTHHCWLSWFPPSCRFPRDKTPEPGAHIAREKSVQGEERKAEPGGGGQQEFRVSSGHHNLENPKLRAGWTPQRHEVRVESQPGSFGNTL